jgi:hypothetical protein
VLSQIFYTFNVSAPADVLGLMLAIDFSPAFNISLASPQLFSGSPGSASVVAPHIGCVSVACSWDIASAGSYFLQVAGNVTNGGGFPIALPVGYGGSIGSVSESVSQAPLPAALPLFASGLAGMGLFGWWRKRRARANVAMA